VGRFLIRGSSSNPSGRTSLYLGFATYRAGLVLPFVATWTALYYVLGRRLRHPIQHRGEGARVDTIRSSCFAVWTGCLAWLLTGLLRGTGADGWLVGPV
jgi:hypothetical protein